MLLKMLGRFLEYSVATPDIRASLEFYSKLGFSQAQVGEVWPHPYAVVTDGRICLGLHQAFGGAPSLTFVKPDLLGHLSSLEKLDLSFEFRRLGNDVFNELGWLDPSGHRLRLIEARTFSPVKRPGTDTSLCGYFLEIGVPTPRRALAKNYWEKLGFVGIDELDGRLPHVSCTSDSVTIGLYEPAHLPRPTLLFEAGDVGATLARLAQLGILPAGQVPSPLRQLPAAMISAPEGTPILLLTDSTA